jgi:sugar phosphate isomerase/epimerase
MTDSAERPSSSPELNWAVFTKPWPGLRAPELGRKIAAMGFDGVELPVRTGFQVEPDRAEQELPLFVRQLADEGLSTVSVAGDLTERNFSACAAAEVPMIRIMAPISGGYRVSVASWREELERMLPFCRRYGVRIGVQQHYGRYVSNSSGLRALLEGFSPREVCAVWDAGHSALAGEDADLGIDQVLPQLGMVNLKNAYYRRRSGDDGEPVWKTEFVTGPEGLARWDAAAAGLAANGYAGTVCLTAQYTDAGESLDELVAADLRFAKSVFSAAGYRERETV